MITKRITQILTLAITLSATGTGRSEVFVSSDLELTVRNIADDVSNRTNYGYSPFDAVRIRTFLDASISDRVSGFVQLFMGGTRGIDVMLYGAYIRYDHTPSVHLDAGLIPTPVGLWGARTYAGKNPLVTVPLIYQYKTAMNAKFSLQTAPAALLENRGLARSTPVLYDFCWNTGVHAYATAGQLGFGAALTNGSLGSPQREIVFDYPNITLHLEWTPAPYLTVGTWGSGGPYIDPSQQSSLPAGQRVEDYNQLIGGALLHAAYGHWDIHAEAIANRFEHPHFGDLENVGGYADVEFAFATRWFTAARVDLLHFSRLADPAAKNERWDYPIRRFEAGIGRNLTPQSRIKAVVQVVRYEDAPASLDDEIVALQYSLGL